MSFYQVWAVRESVYGFVLPSEFSAWADMAGVFSLDIGAWLFPSWTCIGDMHIRLVFNGVWPFALVLALALLLTARSLMLNQASGLRGAVRPAMIQILQVFVSKG